ncbi:enoyl-CoA hydratase/isomerase family protein [Mycobacterium intracellulare]|nr:enoyl-CoA hydratase/isomerase family protein [Mycobacterium intracellulare]
MTTSEIATLPGYEEFAPWLLVEKTGNVHVISINRPEAFNAVNEDVHHAFATIWRVLAADDDVRAVVTTGVGKAFSAGGDMVMFGRLIEDPVARQFQITEARTVFLEVINFPKPLVSAVNGPAVGLGCSIALLSDFLVMGENSYLADPHVAVGLVAGDGGAAMLPLLIGLMKAKEYVLLGDRITPAIADKLNLVTKVATDDTVLDEALAIGERLAGLPPQALRASKVAMNMHLSRAALGVLEYALAEEYTSFSTRNSRSGWPRSGRARRSSSTGRRGNQSAVGRHSRGDRHLAVVAGGLRIAHAGVAAYPQRRALVAGFIAGEKRTQKVHSQRGGLQQTAGTVLVDRRRSRELEAGGGHAAVHDVHVVVQVAVRTLRQHRRRTILRDVHRHQVGERGLARPAQGLRPLLRDDVAGVDEE